MEKLDSNITQKNLSVDNNKSGYFSLVLFLILLGFSPFVFPLYDPRIKYISAYFTFIVFFIYGHKILTNNVKKCYIIYIIILLFQSIFSVFLIVYHDVNLNLLLSYLYVVLLISIISIFDPGDLLNYFIYFILFILILACISFVITSFGILNPVKMFYRNPDSPIYFIFGSFTNEIYRVAGINVIRPAGLFVESGSLGMYATMAALGSYIINHQRKIHIRYFIIFLGLFTFSLGFYITAIMVVLFDCVTSKSRVSILLFATMGVSSVALFLINNKSFSTLSYLFFSRFSLDNHSYLKGFNHRASFNEDSYTLLSQSSIWGVGPATISSLDLQASFVGSIASYGLIGSIFYYMHLIGFLLLCLYLFCKKSYPHLVFIPLILVANLYHRPFVHHIAYYYCIILFSCNIIYDKGITSFRRSSI
jgi:hypothetical protein